MARRSSNDSSPRPADANDAHLRKLRQWRNTPESDLSMNFINDEFKKNIQRPYKQLHAMAQVWSELIPPAILPRTRLVSLQRGVLQVMVDSSSTLYELDRLLRQGLQTQIIRQHTGPAVSRIQLRVGPIETVEP